MKRGKLSNRFLPGTAVDVLSVVRVVPGFRTSLFWKVGVPAPKFEINLTAAQWLRKETRSLEGQSIILVSVGKKDFTKHLHRFVSKELVAFGVPPIPFYAFDSLNGMLDFLRSRGDIGEMITCAPELLCDQPQITYAPWYEDFWKEDSGWIWKESLSHNLLNQDELETPSTVEFE